MWIIQGIVLHSSYHLYDDLQYVALQGVGHVRQWRNAKMADIIEVPENY